MCIYQTWSTSASLFGIEVAGLTNRACLLAPKESSLGIWSTHGRSQRTRGLGKINRNKADPLRGSRLKK